MDTEVNDQQGHSGPPWLQPALQQHIRWRDGDIVISVPPKSGTTWTMNIVHQLLTGGTTDFRDIYEEVPWIEFIGGPEVTQQDVLDRVEAMPENRRRAFKTHSPPPAIPVYRAGSDRDVRYIVVFRNPDEAVVSFWPFLNKHSDAWFDLWQVPRAAVCRPDFSSFYSDVVDQGGGQGLFYGFLAAWWPLRHEPNVLFLHFADMKRDHEASIRKVADFLGIDPGEDRWPTILEYTSFPWMKAHESMFEGSTLGTTVNILQPGGMIRKGQAGASKSDGMTDEISRHMREVGSRICPDEAALAWYYEGGPLP